METIKFPIDPNISHCLKLNEDVTSNLYDLYRKYIKEVNMLYEGLITSYPINQTIKIFNHKGFLISSHSKDANTFAIKITFNNIDACKSQLYQLEKLGETCGWFISELHYGWNIFKTIPQFLSKYLNTTTYLYVYFEAKYDIKLAKLPNTLYHVTPKENGDKILKYGLSPKTQNKNSIHPERIYFFSEYDDDSIQDLARKLYKKESNKDFKSGIYYLLQIRNPEFSIPGLRLYKDPRYLDKGMYTLQAIDPKEIEKIKEFIILDKIKYE